MKVRSVLGAYIDDVESAGYDQVDLSFVENSMQKSMADFGFVLASFDVGFKSHAYRCYVYVNNEKHVYKDHDNSHTNAELAIMFLLGNWNKWYREQLLSYARSLRSRIEDSLIRSSLPIVKKWRAEYNREASRLRKKSGDEILKNILSNRLPKVPSKEEMPSIISKFSKGVNRKRKFGWTREMEEDYRYAIRENWIKKTFKTVSSVSEKDPLLASVISNPGSYAPFFNTITYSALNDVKYSIYELFMGDKEPDIAPKTKQNRYRRKYGHAYTVAKYIVKEHDVKGYTKRDGTTVSGYHVAEHEVDTGHSPDPWEDEGPPLFESGQLARAIMTKVERLK